MATAQLQATVSLTPAALTSLAHNRKLAYALPKSHWANEKPALRKLLAVTYGSPRVCVGALADSLEQPSSSEQGMLAYCYYREQTLLRKQQPTKLVYIGNAKELATIQKTATALKLNLAYLPSAQSQLAHVLDRTTGQPTAKYSELTSSNGAYDGLLLNWNTLKADAFIRFWLHHHQAYQYLVVDGAEKAMRPKTEVYALLDALINHYQGGIKRVVALTTKPFETNLYDFYHLYQWLVPGLIPTKKYLTDNYVAYDPNTFNPFIKNKRVAQIIKQKQLAENADAATVQYKNIDTLVKELAYVLI